MAQYINKSALVAEIENLLDKGKYYDDYDCAFRDGNNSALYALKGKIDTLDVKDANEALRTEYEKGRADVIAKAWEYINNQLNLPSDFEQHFRKAMEE